MKKLCLTVVFFTQQHQHFSARAIELSTTLSAEASLNNSNNFIETTSVGINQLAQVGSELELDPDQYQMELIKPAENYSNLIPSATPPSTE